MLELYRSCGAKQAENRGNRAPCQEPCTWGAWFLAFSTGTASIPIPPIGTLRLDPADLHQVFASLLDAAGRASITFPVPANPTLVGASVYWQAVVASPAAFTNLEITTLTNL